MCYFNKHCNNSQFYDISENFAFKKSNFKTNYFYCAKIYILDLLLVRNFWHVHQKSPSPPLLSYKSYNFQFY